jgi:peptidoglycan/LPS O-acetylase OafA/YrhL
MESPERYHFLDWLRVLAIAVLLFFHTGMLFVGWGWHLTNAETIPELRVPMALAHRLRMPLLFVIAGAGLWFAAQRRSRAELLRERSLRLLVPTIAGMFLIVPPQVFIERRAQGQWRGGYVDFFVQRVLRFEPYPAGDFSWHHLWFIVYLYVYVLLLLPFMGERLRAWHAPKPGVWLYLLALPLALNEALLKPRFPETHNLVNDLYLFNHYLLLTAYGLALAAMRDAWDWFARWRRVSLAAAMVLLVAGLALLELRIIERDTPADALLANVFTWVWLTAFLGYGRQHLSANSRCLAWSREASYPIYILHQTVIIALAFLVIREPWSPWSKYWLVLGATIVVCVLLYEGFLRRFAFTRLLFGIKTRQPLRAASPLAPAATPSAALAAKASTRAPP